MIIVLNFQHFDYINSFKTNFLKAQVSMNKNLVETCSYLIHHSKITSKITDIEF